MALTDNLVAYWNLNGNSSESIGGKKGTDTGITYSTGNGKISQGAGFADSTDSKITASFTAVNWTTEDWTVNIWVNAGTAENAYCGMFSNRVGSPGSWFTLGNVDGGGGAGVRALYVEQ